MIFLRIGGDKTDYFLKDIITALGNKITIIKF